MGQVTQELRNEPEQERDWSVQQPKSSGDLPRQFTHFGTVAV